MGTKEGNLSIFSTYDLLYAMGLELNIVVKIQNSYFRIRDISNENSDAPIRLYLLNELGFETDKYISLSTLVDTFYEVIGEFKISLS